MTLYSVDLPRERYLGHHTDIMDWHSRLSIRANMNPFYNVSDVMTTWGTTVPGHLVMGYRYSFEDRRHAVFFKLRWC